MKKLFISPYFGKLPNYFQLFLDSCALNENFCDFLIVTDDIRKFKIPQNVTLLSMTFEELNELTKQKIGKQYEISSPYKICDYRPAFGKIFEDRIAGYDFWGHVDTDVILGKLSNFFTDDVFDKYDRLLERGALMLYRNQDEINELFRQETKGIINFREAANTQEPCFYDEIMFPALMSSRGYAVYSNTAYADILPQNLRLKIDGHCTIDNIPDQFFIFDKSNGLFQSSLGNVEIKECMYIHLQKRPMSLNISSINNYRKLYISATDFSQENRLTSIRQLDELKWKFKYMTNQLNKLDLKHLTIHLKARALKKRMDRIDEK